MALSLVFLMLTVAVTMQTVAQPEPEIVIGIVLVVLFSELSK